MSIYFKKYIFRYYSSSVEYLVSLPSTSVTVLSHRLNFDRLFITLYLSLPFHWKHMVTCQKHCTRFVMCLGFMMTSSNGNIVRVTGILCWEFPSQCPVTRSFGEVLFDLRLNQQLSKQWRNRWLETQRRSLWRHCNVAMTDFIYVI